MLLLTNFLGTYYRSGLRGSFRLSDFLSKRLKSLQSVPIETESGTLYADLRISSARGILANPKSMSGEDLAMRKFVKKGDVIFDIGAHFGFYTLLLSELVGEKGKVFAFEPNPELLPSLRKTVQPLANVELQEIALSDREGDVNLFVPEDASMASLSDWTDGIAGNVHTVACEMRRLDDLVEAGKLPVPQFIKCDVEGAELLIFKGSVNTLNRVDAPVILFEANALAAKSFGANITDYFDFLKSLKNPKYSFFEVSTKGLEKLKAKEIEFTNIIAVPKAMQDFCKNILN
ncbi:hypothetical protein BH10ACI1_BH10ACI1_07010 [soil metagenome]